MIVWKLRRRSSDVFFNLGRHGRVPSKHAIKTWIKNFEETGSALKKKPTGRPRSAPTPQNIEAVRVSVLRSPRRSVRKLAAAVFCCTCNEPFSTTSRSLVSTGWCDIAHCKAINGSCARIVR